MSVDSPFLPVRRFDATSPITEIVAGLNRWQPENLVCYASMGHALAEEQLAGRLHIHPQAIMCSSEVLTAKSRQRIHEAFAVEPFNVYAATESAGIASECERHRMHLYEDLVITEVVDDGNRPVPVGVVGAKLLVTVLFSRTQPLIRYEMSDTISVSNLWCECGRGFRLLEAIAGRAEDVLTLPATGANAVRIHPNVFHQLLDSLAIRQWQVEQTTEGLVIHIVPGTTAVNQSSLVADLMRQLQAAGASSIPIHVDLIDAIAKTALGKAPLVKALRGAPADDRQSS